MAEEFPVLVIAQGLFDLRCVPIPGCASGTLYTVGGGNTRMVVTLVHEMVRTGAARGLATLCIGVGQGVATIIARE